MCIGAHLLLKHSLHLLPLVLGSLLLAGLCRAEASLPNGCQMSAAAKRRNIEWTRYQYLCREEGVRVVHLLHYQRQLPHKCSFARFCLELCLSARFCLELCLSARFCLELCLSFRPRRRDTVRVDRLLS
eukprot:COSAG03_NODE_232_length_10264_cov_2.708706_7_plen_129_part_00